MSNIKLLNQLLGYALPHANLDESYGPYTTLEEAYLKTKLSKAIGLTVGIYTFDKDDLGEYVESVERVPRTLDQTYPIYEKNDIATDKLRYSISGIVEYWWKKGTEDKDLEPKLIGTGLDDIEFTVISNPDNSVEITYVPIGSSIFSLNSVSLYRDNILLSSANFNLDGQTFRFENVQPGEYTYKILIVDIFGLSISKLKTITVGIFKITTQNLSNITGLLKITSSTIVEKLFGINILILNPDWEDADFGIYADETKINSLLFTSNGSNKNITINITSELAQLMDGHIIYVKSRLDEIEYEYELFKVLGSDVLFAEIIRKPTDTFYLNSIYSITLKFTSGANSFYILSDDSSDFSFNSLTVNFNQLGIATIPMYVTPNKIESNSHIVFLYGDNKTLSLPLGEILEQPDSNRYASWDTSFPTNATTSSCYIDFTGVIIPNRETGSDTENDSNVIIRFNDLMYITNDVIHVNDIEIATPLNEKVYVGLGFGLLDINPNRPIEQGGSTGYYTYDCICINGTIVKISPLNRKDNQVITWYSLRPSSKYIDILKKGSKLCEGYWLGDPSLNLFNSLNVPLCEINYLEDGFGDNEVSKIIPSLYLEVIDNPQADTYAVWKSNFHNVSFGTVFDGANKYGNSLPSDSEFKLVKIDEPLKSKCLKYYGVVCRYYYTNTNNDLPNSIAEIQSSPDWKTGIVTVYTQGTSTLRYSIPNFKFYFKEDFTLDYGDNESINEKILTAKADYMESSHLNNTPTAMLYNKIVKSNIITDKSPSASLGLYKDAIVGSPIKLMIKDRGSNIYNNFGSFMLNTDKTSNTLGFELSEDCISFEGTSNFNNTGLSSRYIISPEVKNSFDTVYNLIINNGESNSWYCDEFDKKGKGIIRYITDGFNEVFNNQTNASNYIHIVKVLKYLSEGLEYRYPDSDIIESEDPEEGSSVYSYIIMPYEHFVLLFTMFYRIANVDTLNTDIGSVFNLEYCYLYIIFMLILGQTDNLGKNCMFDCWKSDGTWGKWFPRPYDLDSQCGLNNNGEEVIPPFVQVSRNWIPDQSLRDSPIFDNSYRYKYMPTARIFGYSSATSKLWETIFIKYLNEINSMYADLRDSYFNYDNLESHYQNIIIDKIPIHLYNIDFLNKYLGSLLLSYMLGNRWTNFKDWIKMRIAFCDGFFLYKKATYQINTELNFNVKYIFPAYAIINSGQSKSYFFGLEINEDSNGNPIVIGGSAATQPDIFLSDSLVLSTSLYDNGLYTSSPNDEFAFENLQTLTLGGAIYPDLTKCKLLDTLIITETCSIKNFVIPNNVQILNCEALIQSLTIDENSLLTSISLKNANLKGDLDLTNCTKLLNLTLNSCVIEGDVILGSGEYNFSTTNCTFHTITSDSESQINDLDLSHQHIYNLNLAGKLKRLDLFKTEFTNDSVQYKDLDLTNISELSTLNLIGCNIDRVKIGNNTFDESLKLGMQDSNVSIFGKIDSNDLFIYDGIDLTVLPDTVTSILNYNGDTSTGNAISSIYSLGYNKTSKRYTGLSTSTSSSKSMELSYMSMGKLSKVTKIKVKPITYGVALFAQCGNLTTVEYIKSKETDPSNAKLYSNWLFYASSKLSNISNIKIGQFSRAFIGTTLAYSYIENLIDNESSNGNFNYFYALANPASGLNITINPEKYPPITNLSGMFSQGNYNTFTEKTGKKFNITMSSPLKVTNDCTSISYIFDSCGTISIPDLFIIKSSGDNISALDQITYASRSFRLCTINNGISILNELINLTGAQGMFSGATIGDNIANNHLELVNTQLTNLAGMFHTALFSSADIEIDDFIKNLTGSTITLDTCFYDSNVYINEDFTINNNTNVVTINGFLANSNSSSSNNQNTPTTIIYNNKFKLKEGGTSITTPTSTSTSYSSYGPFANRKTTSSSIELNPTVNKNLAYYLRGVSRNDNSTLNVTISNPNNINGVCWDASNVFVTFSTNVSCSAESAFLHCIFDNLQVSNLDLILLDNITNASKMFAGSNITKITFDLPSTITNVISMFNLCKRLRGGLPSEFFLNSLNITDVSRMFYLTKITVKNEGDTGRSNSIKLPSQVTKANGTFAVIYTGSATSLYDIEINNGVLTEMEGIFASCSSNNNIIISNIASNSKMSYAFANRKTVPSGINLSTLFSTGKIRDGRGMFYNEKSNSNSCSEYTIPNNVLSDGFFYNWLGWDGPDITIPGAYREDRLDEMSNTSAYSTTYIN